MRIKIDDAFSVTVEQLIDNDRAWFERQGRNAFNIPLEVEDFTYRLYGERDEVLLFAVTGTVDEEELEAVLAAHRP
ncbi:MAG: hypothetical protein E6R04_06610 [Spirochaetes bacterium]|nr:MAG: hypothetical protein E6R04_06610 [Spirochaetota bacterium]